jgi:hypothetical protein
MRRLSCTLVVAAVIAGWAAQAVSETDDSVDSLESIDRSLVRGNQLLRAKKYDEAHAAFDEAAQHLAALRKAGIPEDQKSEVETLQKRLATAQRTIVKRQTGIAKSAAVAKAKQKDSLPKRNSAQNRGANQPGSPPKDAPQAPKFSVDIAPILLARCGNCHVNASPGGLNMANFAALARGSRDGPIIAPGASDASRLVEVIFTGKMPRGGGQVAPEELATISLWIDAGARFDGADPTAPLGQQPLPTAQASEPQAKDVLFVRDLAATIVGNCLECHTGDKPAGELRLDSFAALLEGGASGKIFEPGRPRDSLLVKRLRGIDGARMPKDKAPLASELITGFETWIKNGARFDGYDPAMLLTLAVEKSEATRLTHAEFTAKRVASAEKIWARAFPAQPVKSQQTGNFIVLGSASDKRLAQVAKVAEAQRAKITKLLKLSADAPLVKGSLVLFVVASSDDYGEFVRAVEQREPSAGVQGHAQSHGADLYSCFILGDGDDSPALVAEQIAAGFLLSLSNVPPWFAAGAGRSIAARVEPKSPLVKKWDLEMQNLTTAESAEQLVSAERSDREMLARRYALVQNLTRKLPQFQSLVLALEQNQDFDQALVAVYRHDASELVELWLRHNPAGK